MPDIAACMASGCSRSEQCRRYLLARDGPCHPRQSFIAPQQTGADCHFFYPTSSSHEPAQPAH